MNAFLEPLRQLEAYSELLGRLKKTTGVTQLTGCVESQKVHMAYGFGADFKRNLILTYSEKKAKEIYEEYRFFEPEAVLYPAKDFLFFHADLQGKLLVQQRISAVQALLSRERVTIITTLDGCMDKLLPLEEIRGLVLHVETGEVLQIDAWAAKLVFLGYERTGQVETPGQFAIRGGILDIFPLTEENPVRV